MLTGDFGPTCPGQSLVGLIAEKLGEASPLGVDGLLHGFHPHPQVAVLSLQHGVLMEHVAEALHAVLAHHAFTLQERTAPLHPQSGSLRKP